MSGRIVVIGIDGATFDVMKPLMARGALPHLARLLESGVHGDLRSTTHPITPQAWTTFLTGMNAGKHGIFDFVARKPGTYDVEFINAGQRKTASVFRYLSGLGLNVGCVGVPFTYPPEPVNGFMLSGFDAPAEDERSVYPKNLYRDIRRRFGQYYIHLASPVGRTADEEKFWQDIQTEDRNRTDIGLYLLERFPCDVFMIVYNNVDRVQHQYLTYERLESIRDGRIQIGRDILAKTYVNADHEVGRILEKLGDDDIVIIMSDHGSGPIREFFHLNRWLEKSGYLNYRDKGRLGSGLVEKARYLSKRLLPRKIKGIIKGFLPQVRDRVESFRFFSEIDWDRTMAYGFGMYGNIYLNRKGREPQGIVQESRHDEICQSISDQLLQLQDPTTGAVLVDKVYRKTDLFTGPYLDDAPDLIIGWKDYAYYTATGPGRETGPCFGGTREIDSSDFAHVGTHRLNGVLMAGGKGIERDLTIEGAEICDLAPTILYALDQPILNEMDGRILSRIFADGIRSSRPPRYTAADGQGGGLGGEYSPDEAKKVQERLKGIGYF